MAQDFFWHIWRALGNELPTKLEASLPSLGAKLMIRLPQSYEEAKSINPDFEEPTSSVDPMYWSSLTPEAFVQTIQNAVSTVPEWQEIAENAAERGLNPVLAWRRGNYLEWVRHEHTVSKQARPWSLVAGLAMAQVGRSLP